KRVPDNKLDVVPNALKWRLGRSNSAILTRESRDKKAIVGGAPYSRSTVASLAFPIGRSKPPLSSRSGREFVSVFDLVNAESGGTDTYSAGVTALPGEFLIQGPRLTSEDERKLRDVAGALPLWRPIQKLPLQWRRSLPPCARPDQPQARQPIRMTFR